jgi:hypothetical protein
MKRRVLPRLVHALYCGVIRISAKLVTRVSAVLAALCFALALTGLMTLDRISDPAQLEKARGMAGFWLFLAGAALLIGVLAWWFSRTSRENE